MLREVTHIKDYLDESTFPWKNVELKTRFGMGTLLVFCENEEEYTEYIMTIEKYFDIIKTRKVRFEDFK